MKVGVVLAVLVWPVWGAAAASAAGGVAAKVPLPLKLPPPAFKGTLPEVEENEHLEPLSDQLRPPFLVPEGTRLLSRGQPVTSSDQNPVNGTLDQVTDGIKDAGESNTVELHRKLQWVQVDLGRPARLQAIVVWHGHDTVQVVHDVVVQVADDADFTQRVRTLYNNDYDHSSGLGLGTDKEYFENHEGRLMNARGEVARFVRCYSQGTTLSGLNPYVEVEVFGASAAETAVD